MRNHKTVSLYLLVLSIFMACDLGEAPQPDPQFIQLHFKYGFGNAVNTFDGTLTKDLVLDGSVTVPFWFTTREQQLILNELNRLDFYSLSDTLPAITGVVVEPEPGPMSLRVRVDQRDKTVVWSLPLDETKTEARTVRQLSSAIWDIVQSTTAYKHLPSARGGRI